jgi:hypothetical protein
MKKSEMLEILKETLRDTELNAWASCEACSFLEELIERDAPKILTALEKAGMLPPESDKTDYCDCGFHDLGDLKWEPEDD